ncbi:N-acetylmuramoyl-L-alanine amidase [Paracoccus sanguinis]|uniref:N-acetylmuramoyl-L-alanine amidase n=1 Tax=Paracoccus sanguinis TaxID=1545044 RepID=A0A099GMC0_9RHOB|nr:N-acetylmuramoyl-L-alanine amidase [Paracoccus sanguinis]KGJ23263.1 N-acetylmuramoyl-L-alanine amidase [Paracoccus sanguinis]
MRVKNHRMEGVPYKAARNIGGVITPEIVVLHDTAGRLEKGNSAAYLRDNKAGVSVHFVVERDGSIEQQVPLNRRAAHAGKSSFHGRSDCNDFSIGIEIVNPGRLAEKGKYQGISWWGETFDIDKDNLAWVETKPHGSGLWMAYTPEQIEAVLDLLTALFAGVPSLRDITTHWYISPGRKVDTNPLFPIEGLRARVLGRDDPADALAEAGSELLPTATMLRIKAPGDTLNMRRWPSFENNVVGAIPHGTVLPAIRGGTFGDRAWTLVQYAGREGWIVDAYTEIV